MFESSKIILSRKALRHNLKFIQSLLQPGVQFCSVVKGNAYGHGLAPFVQIAMEEGVNYFAVHEAAEAAIIHKAFNNPPRIFIMGYVEAMAISWAIENDVEFSVYDFERLEQAISIALQKGKPARIHIEIETGMQRTGFKMADWNAIAQIVSDNTSCIILVGLFTHFAGSESVINNNRIVEQENLYQQALKIFEEKGLHPIFKHIACSAALLNYPHTQLDMVRIGILQYGFWPNEETFYRYHQNNSKKVNLQRVISWQTTVMALKTVEKGNYIGYGNTFKAPRDMKLAIIPVGYSHGYARNLSNIGSVLIAGKSAPVLGIINMNSLTVDVSKIPTVSKGDVVILIGRQKSNSISVSSFSEQSQLLNYEMLTRLPENIPREIE
jgi:alanine racemase